MIIGVLKEIQSGEKRVAMTPEVAQKLQKLGFSVVIESGAGIAASYSDNLYLACGVQILPTATEVWAHANIIIKVRPPATLEVGLCRPSQIIISLVWPAQNKDLIQALAERKATLIGMDQIPRISRAQKMDVLSSMANIAGYRAVVEAANCFGRFFTGQVTAAGKVAPAKVLVIGAGVAGLSAIGTAKAMGAIVRAFDTRPEVKDQVKSMGGDFLELHFEEDGSGEGGYAKVMSPEFIKAEMDLFLQQAKEVDIIITTALIPGVKAPLLITEEMVHAMKPGSIIVDMAAEQGGNCALTKPGEVYDHQGVKIIGYTDLPSRLASTASQLYATNIFHLLSDMGGGLKFNINKEDEVVRGALVLEEGTLLWPAPKVNPSPQASAASVGVAAVPFAKEVKSGSSLRANIIAIAASIILMSIAGNMPTSFLNNFTVLVLGSVIGWQLVWNVSPSLHTPLMSVTNAISGIIIIGGMLQLSSNLTSLTTILGAISVFIATINIAGGFLVTQRMLKMFRRAGE